MMKRLLGALLCWALFLGVVAAQTTDRTAISHAFTAITTGSTPVLVANNNRNFLQFQTESANDIYCMFGTTAVLHQGFRVAASQSPLTFGVKVPVGTMSCIVAATPATLMSMEGSK